MTVNDQDRSELIRYRLSEAKDTCADVDLETVQEMADEMKDFIDTIEKFLGKS